MTAFIPHLARAAAACIFAAWTFGVASAWPAPYHGQSMHTLDGVLLDYSRGPRWREITIRLSTGRKRIFETLPGTTFEHRQISCILAPSQASPCPDWPHRLVLGKAVVRVKYFIGENAGPGIPGPQDVAVDVSVK